MTPFKEVPHLATGSTAALIVIAYIRIINIEKIQNKANSIQTHTIIRVPNVSLYTNPQVLWFSLIEYQK